MISGVERSSGRNNEESLTRALLSGECQLWVVFAGDDCLAACVTRLAIAPSGQKSVDVLSASGHDRAKWSKILRDTIADFGRKEGCAIMEMLVRPGWEREYTDMKKTHVMLEMRLD